MSKQTISIPTKPKKILMEEEEPEYNDDEYDEEQNNVENEYIECTESDEKEKDKSNNETNDTIIVEKYNNKELVNFFFDRYAEGINDFNMLLIGKVSSGKTTLLNALLGDCYSESKIQKTTKGISLYITSNNTLDASLDRQTIFDINKSVQTSQTLIPFNIFQVPNTKIVDDYNGTRVINIFDTVGMDDPDENIDKMTQKWITKNAPFIDVFLIVVDIQKALTTRSDEKTITKIISKCNNNIIFVVNKFDYIDDIELNELYCNFVQKITKIMENLNRTNFSVCRISALREYIMKLTKNGKTDRLTASEKELSQIITTSNFGELNACFYSELTNSQNLTSSTKSRIMHFIEKDLETEISLNKFCNIMTLNSNINFSEEELGYLTEEIYNCMEYNSLTDYDKLGFQYPDFNKSCDIVMRLKKYKINKMFEGTEICLDNVCTLISNTSNYDEKNIILKIIFDKEKENIMSMAKDNDLKPAKSQKSYYKSNEKHNKSMVTYSKLISVGHRHDILKETLVSYINLLVQSNILCDTISVNLPNIVAKKDYKQSLKVLVHFLLLTNPEKYEYVFSKYNALKKLMYPDCNINSEIGQINKFFFVELDMDNIQNYFECVDEIYKLSIYLDTYQKN